MNFAYDWAFSKPCQELFHNVIIPALSIAVALVIGTIELAGIVVQNLGHRGSLWTWLQNTNIGALHYVIVGLLLATWFVAVLIWRFAHVGERSAPTEMPRLRNPNPCEGVIGRLAASHHVEQSETPVIGTQAIVIVGRYSSLVAQGRLASANCTTGWLDWSSGQLWLLPEGFLRLHSFLGARPRLTV